MQILKHPVITNKQLCSAFLSYNILFWLNILMLSILVCMFCFGPIVFVAIHMCGIQFKEINLHGCSKISREFSGLSMLHVC